jgi:hypothetical protein
LWTKYNGDIMRQIPGEQLWFGNTGDVRDLRHLFGAGIAAVVDLALDELPPPLPHELIYCRVPLVDGAGNEPALLRLAVQAIITLLDTKLPTLVCCSNGLSRSPSMAAAAIAVRSGISPDDALRRIMEVHHLDVTPGLWQEIKTVAVALAGLKSS